MKHRATGSDVYALLRGYQEFPNSFKFDPSETGLLRRMRGQEIPAD